MNKDAGKLITRRDWSWTRRAVKIQWCTSEKMATLNLCLIAAFALSFCNTSMTSPNPDLWLYFKNTEGTTVNKTKLLLLASRFYIAPPVCSNTSLPNSEPQLYRGKYRPCNCAQICIGTDTCCFDHPYKAVTQNCTNVVVFPQNARLTLEYKIVNTCDLHGLPYAELCDINRNITVTINEPIVTSRKSGLSYNNKYCAFCYLEQEINLVSWILILYCRQEMTKEALTSTDIMSLLKTNIRNETCIIAYFPDRVNYIAKKCMVNKTYSLEQSIQTCNVTGLWVSYDADLLWACKHFFLPYHGFRNVFCYICNPSIVSVRETFFIDQCNTTGLWKNFDSDILTKCESFEIESRWRPFKNMYCLFCNSFNANMDPGQYNLMTLYPNTEMIVSEWYDQDNNTFISLLQASIKSSNEYSMNETLRISLANTCRDLFFCPKENQNANDDGAECMSCSCSSQCPTKMSCCRKYAAVEDSFMCIPNDVLSYNNSSSSEKAFLAFGSCPKETDGLIRRKCEHPDTNDIFQVLPVIALEEIVFRNVYCGQCNGIFHSKPFDLIVECDIYVDAALFTTFKEFIDFALQEKCSLKYLSQFDCEKKQNYISKCNTTGLWQSGSMAIQTACELTIDSKMSLLGISEFPLQETFLEDYLNIYCYICNPKEIMPLYDRCNVTGSMTKYDKRDETLCLSGDRDFVWGPYKNVYCLMCNSVKSYYRGIILESILQPSYRTIFQVPLNFLEIYNQEEGTTVCPDRKVPCEKVLCSEGKVFQNNSCDYPIGAVLSQMEYGLYFRTELSGPVTSNSFQMSIRVDDIIHTFWKVLSLELSKFDSKLITWKFHVWTSFPCNALLLADDAVLYAFVTMQIMKISGNFKLLEVHFMNEMGQTIMLNDSKIAVKLIPDYKLFYFLQTSSNMSESGCYLHNDSCVDSDINLKVFSDILTCTQRELSYEFVLDNFKNVYIPIKNITLNKFQFEFISETRIKICSELFAEIENITELESIRGNELIASRPYAIFSFSCSCLSIFCLLLTLLAYLIHSELRTRPGKLNIGLVVSLLLAQSSLQFGLKQTGFKYLCICIGIFIHLSWLTTFFCFNICTWNIYITFTSDLATMNQISLNRGVPICYILYMVGVPLTIVVGTLVFHLARSKLEYCGYGGPICFISDDVTSVVSFISPVVFICFVNTLLYALSFHSLRKQPALRTNVEKRNQFFIYLKLFFITGISWILQIADAVFVLTPLSYFSTLINALQGLFVFLAFVCNKRVLILCKIYLNQCFEHL